MVTLSKSLDGSVTSSDSWIHSVTMSTRENVVLEGHTEELTSTTCVWNAQNIQVFHHSHESFSTCAAGHQALTSTVPPEGSLTIVSFDIWCQNGRLAISPSKPSPPYTYFYYMILISVHWPYVEIFYMPVQVDHDKTAFKRSLLWVYSQRWKNSLSSSNHNGQMSCFHGNKNINDKLSKRQSWNNI